MVLPSSSSRNSKSRNKAIRVAMVVASSLIVLFFLHNLMYANPYDYIPDLPVDYKVDSKCTNLAAIKPSRTFTVDPKVHNVPTLEKISPSFKIGSYFGPKVAHHMGGDTESFDLIKELLDGKEGGLTFDMGANQGFFTYYLATLGMQVHSFEISKQNFVALQHGTTFNPKEVSDRVNLYSVGLGEKTAHFSMKGGKYDGYLKEGKGGDILGTTFDCFAHHSKLDLRNVAFVKLDVEGFEIGVLKGAHNSLFHKTSSIGGMLMEVGPNRWNRAQVDLATGTTEMKKLATHFKKSYLLIRKSGSYAKTCPSTLAKILSNKVFREMTGVDMYEVRGDEWEPLMAKMEKTGMDCNFWYTNK